MKSSVFFQGLAAFCIATTASAVSAQNTAIQLFSPADVRHSTTGTGYNNENIFNTKPQNLTCPASPKGVISSTADGMGNVLVDNFVTLTVQGTTTTGPSNICSGGTVENGTQQNCFTPTYSGEASIKVGVDPTTLASTGGVPPIDISSSLQEGSIQATISLVDTGGFLAGSALYLVTNCTPGGVTGSIQVTGNPISPTSPTPQQLTQSYPINPTTGQLVQFTYDLSQSEANQNLTIPAGGATPSTGSMSLDSTKFQTNYLANSSFATANCLIHTGELYTDPNGNTSPGCTLYTLTCQRGSNPDQAGALCPDSSAPDEIFQEIFDGPSFSLPDITGAGGQTFHQGVGFLEASEGWTGGSCVFDPNSSLAGQICPLNVLNSFSGPGYYKSGAGGKDPNSAFITVAPVPEVLTTVSVPGQNIPGYWINKSSFNVNFTSTPPSFPAQTDFVPQPVATLSYGISPASTVPQPPAPVAGDTLLTNTACPSNKPVAVYQPASQPITLADGMYLLHYFAQDCAGTQELKFTQDNNQSWSTSFYTYPINVDTIAPVVASGPTLSPAPSTNGGVANSYLQGQQVTASYSCTDERSGIVTCGTSTYTPGSGVLSTGPISKSPVNTDTPGSQTYTVNAVDAAGNQTSASVTYLVVAPSVNLYLLKVAPRKVKHNGTLGYAIAATLFGKQTTSEVTITDPLPAGVTFQQAKVQQLCSKGKCSNTASCSFANNTVTCTSSSLSLRTPILVEIDVSVQAPVGTTIKNTATLSSANPAVSPSRTESSATTFVCSEKSPGCR
jgi:uncharacterized repeat protein (TIGR01451 family)